MPEPQHLVVELSQESLSQRHLRIVMDNSGRLTLERRRKDRLGHASWRSVELPGPEHQEVVEILGATIVAQLNAWPSWFERPAPEYETTSHGKVHICEVSYRCFEGRMFRESVRMRVASVEAEQGESDRPGTFFHYCRLESASCDALGSHGWCNCDFEDLPSKYSDPLSHLAETVVSLSGIRHEKDHKATWYRAEVVPPSRFVACSCGASRSDGDYETVIRCRHCGNVTGPAQ